MPLAVNKLGCLIRPI